MSLENMLQYQEIDIQLRRLLDVIEKSEDFKKIEQAKSEFNLAKKTVEESDKAALSLVEFFASSQKYFQDAQKKADELERAAEKPEEDLDALLAQLNKLKGRLGELESKIAEKKKKADAVVKAYSSANDRGRKIREIHSNAKARQDVLIKSKEPEINDLKRKLSQIEPKIDKEMLRQYKIITSERKYPAFVEAYADGKTYSCRGCGIALSQKNSTYLADNGYCVCESCRRYIYKR